MNFAAKRLVDMAFVSGLDWADALARLRWRGVPPTDGLDTQTDAAPRVARLEAAMAAGGSACLSGWGERLVEEAKDPLAVAGWLGGWTDATRGDAPLDLPRHGETGMAYFDRTGRTVRTLGRGRALNAVDWSSWVWSDVEQDWTVPSTAFRSARR